MHVTQYAPFATIIMAAISNSSNKFSKSLLRQNFMSLENGRYFVYSFQYWSSLRENTMVSHDITVQEKVDWCLNFARIIMWYYYPLPCNAHTYVANLLISTSL